MRPGLFFMTLTLVLTGAGLATAQTIYNAPTGQGSSTDKAKLYQPYTPGPSAAARTQQALPSVTAPPVSSDYLEFQKRQNALNAWADKRNKQANAEQAAGIQYMADLSMSPNPRIFGGIQPVQGPTSLPMEAAPTGKMIYKKDDGIETPQLLFNSPN